MDLTNLNSETVNAELNYHGYLIIKDAELEKQQGWNTKLAFRLSGLIPQTKNLIIASSREDPGESWPLVREMGWDTRSRKICNQPILIPATRAIGHWALCFVP
jgi:hypothetical protein